MADSNNAANQVRVDHHSFQRAVSVSALGFFLQAGMGVTLLVFGLVAGDTAFLFTSYYVLAGIIVWLGLLVVFYQHKLERLEALEEDELTANRPSVASVFDAAGSEVRVAGRRLKQMYRWLMPAVSILLAIILALLAWGMLLYLSEPSLGGGTASNLKLTAHTGWAIAITIAFTAIGFVFSRFVAGMAKLQAWQNLRGGAAYMVGNWLVLTAVVIGILFRFFNDVDVIVAIAWAIPIYMLLVAAEICLNFVMNLYRPRMPGETPRAAFDSKVHSLLAAPDSLVRSMNEAVNYQFGFDVSSTWGYQLLIRSFIWLIALAIGALIVLNTVVVVGPQDQAIRLRSGAIVGEGTDRVADSGLLWKLPWPLESTESRNVDKVQILSITPRLKMDKNGQQYLNYVNLWSDKIGDYYEEPLEPFLVRSSNLQDAASGNSDSNSEDERSSELGDNWALVDAELEMRYQIKKLETESESSLVDYLMFASDKFEGNAKLSTRERIMRRVAMREAFRFFADQTLDEALSGNRGAISSELRRRIQARLDELHAGINVLDVTMALVRPSGTVGEAFEELALSREAQREQIALARRDSSRLLTNQIGGSDLADELIEKVEKYNDLKMAYEDALRNNEEELPVAKKDIIEARQEIEAILFEGGGLAAQRIADAETERWVALMDSRTQATRVQGQQKAYAAAPSLYRERGMMGALTQNLGGVRKYVIGLEADRLNVDLSLTEMNPLLNFSDALGEDSEEGSSE
jgi:regulator of protease activity HflC (stomatin/prohibitin superfamily)